MVGRKPALPPSEVINALLAFSDRVVYNDINGKKKIVVETDKVWLEVSKRLNSLMSTAAIHTFVYEGRYGIKQLLGFPDKITQASENAVDELNQEVDNNSSISDNSDDSQLPSKQFVFTFSPEEWRLIQPQEVVYKLSDKSRPIGSSRSYLVLPKGNWTHILAEHFWEHFHLPCCLSFKRAKAYKNGKTYLEIVGRCSICQSFFKGTVSERPSGNSRVLMQYSYTGNFEEQHKTKKRRLIGPAIEKALKTIVDEKISTESYREVEAVRLMKQGDPEPPIIPSANSLRTLKSRHIAAKKRHDDTITSLAIMKSEDDFKDIVRDMSCHPFFVHYHCGEQIHLYRDYCSRNSNPQLIIDATGSVVNNFQKFGIEKTRSIFLYEAIVSDAERNRSFTVTNMLSERHNTITIFNWLAKWLSCDVLKPKQTVCDQSLALLSAITQCFTQYSSLETYIIICADLIKNDNSINSHLLPKCFIRVDVAHFIKLVTRWNPLKLISPRVKEVILRTIGIMVKSKMLENIRTLLLSLFVVFTNETKGNSLETELQTPCEKHYDILFKATSTGFVDFQQNFDEIIANVEMEDEARETLEKEYDSQYEGLSEHNPFKTWAEEIHTESKALVEEINRSEINPMYLPSLVPYIIKIMKLLPLWSSIMVPIFGYGDETASSAAVESSFQKLKNVTLKHMTLPINVETFMEHHIQSLRGSSILKCGNNEVLSRQGTDNSNDCIFQPDSIIFSTTVDTSDVYSKGLFPSVEEAHNENEASEAWNRKPKNRLKSHSYLLSNPHLRHLNLNTSKNIKTIPLLKNGSRAEELKSCKLKNLGGSVILSNTCAFDSISSILMISYCDSESYSNTLLQNRTKYVDFLSKIVLKGISSSTYVERAEIIINALNPNMESIRDNITLFVCDTTAVNILEKILSEFPTIRETVSCTNQLCGKRLSYHSISCIKFQTTNGEIRDLQTFVNDRLITEKLTCMNANGTDESYCGGLKTIKAELSTQHIFVEIIYWRGENVQHSSEAGCQLNVMLCENPPFLKHREITYELRGAVHFRRGLSQLRDSIGNYTAYTRRHGKNWELHDDLKKKSLPVKDTTRVLCELLVYTV